MWRCVLAALVLGLCGCTGADIDTDAKSGTTTIVLPTDVIESRAAVWQDAADAAGEICPSGWKLRNGMDLPSDVMWQIYCVHPAAVVKPAP